MVIEPRRHGVTEKRGLFHEELTDKLIAAAIEVHRSLGPGLLESAYEECYCHEMSLLNIPIERQKQLPLTYEAQLLTYLKLSGLRVGLIMNFHSARIKDGIKRLVL